MGTKYDVLSGTGTFDGYQAQGKGDGRIYMYICIGRLAGAVLSGLIFLSLFIHACIKKGYIKIYVCVLYFVVCVAVLCCDWNWNLRRVTKRRRKGRECV